MKPFRNLNQNFNESPDIHFDFKKFEPQIHEEFDISSNHFDEDQDEIRELGDIDPVKYEGKKGRFSDLIMNKQFSNLSANFHRALSGGGVTPLLGK